MDVRAEGGDQGCRVSHRTPPEASLHSCKDASGGPLQCRPLVCVYTKQRPLLLALHLNTE